MYIYIKKLNYSLLIFFFFIDNCLHFYLCGGYSKFWVGCGEEQCGGGGGGSNLYCCFYNNVLTYFRRVSLVHRSTK